MLLLQSPGAPILNVEIECSPNMRQFGDFYVASKVTYERQPTNNTEKRKPIMFHTDLFTESFYQLYRQRGATWEKCRSGQGPGFFIVDNPDIPVIVGKDEHFVCLHPGESWSTKILVQGKGWSNFPSGHPEPRDKCKYIFIGGTVDWWDWGDSEDHQNTVVKLPCFL